MGKYDDYKKLTLPLSVVKKRVTTVNDTGGIKTTAGPGNEGIVLVDWIQEMINIGLIDPGAVTVVGTNLTNTPGVNTVTIFSDSGTDTILPAATSLLAGVMTASDKNNLDSIVTLTGVPALSTNLGSFTGTLIPDNVDIKFALQSLETGLGLIPTIVLDDLLSADTAITVSNGTGAIVNGDVTLTFNPGNVLLSTLGGSLDLTQLDTTGATVGQIITFDGTDFVATTYVPPAVVHNDTTGIQGGIATEYYHLALSPYTKITNTTANKLLGRVSTAGEIQELGLTGSLEFNSTNLRLVNDSTSPGNSMYYGTGVTGIKGWFSSLTSGTVTNVSATNSADLTFTITNPTTTPDITAILTNTGVIADTYGDPANVGVFTVNSKGRITSAISTPIILTSTNISNFSEAVDDRVSSLLVAGTNITLTYNDPSNTLTINSTASVGSGVTNQVAYWTSSTVLGGDVDFIFDGTYLTLGTATPSSLARFTTKGLGNSLSTFGIVHQALSGNEVFKVADNGAVQIGSLGEIYLHPDAINLATGGTFPITVSGGDMYLNSDTTILVEGGGTASNTPSFKSVATRSTTIGSLYNAQITGTINMTLGGSNAFSDLYIDTVVNQTLHTGPIRSIYVNPTITAANNYTGVEIDAPGQTALKTTAGDVSFTLGGDAEGDIYYRDASGNLVNLGIGGPTEVLGSTGTVPAWTTTAGSLPGGSNGDVLMYAGGAWVSASPIVEKQTGITGTGVTLGATPLGSLLFVLYRNGIYQDATDDYSIMGNAITMVTALVSSDKITAIYYT